MTDDRRANKKGPGNSPALLLVWCAAYRGEEPPDVLVDPIEPVDPAVPVEPIEPVEDEGDEVDDEPLLRDERPERDEAPVVPRLEPVDDIAPLPVVPPIEPELIEPEPIDPPPLIEPEPIDPEPIDPVEPDPIEPVDEPPLLDMPAPEAPAEPDPPAAPDAPAPPPAAPPPADCAMTATGVSATTAAMMMDLRIFLSNFSVSAQPAAAPGVPASCHRGPPAHPIGARSRAPTRPCSCLPVPMRSGIPHLSSGLGPRWQARSRVAKASLSRALFAWKAAAAFLVQRVPRRATGPRGSSAKDLRINRMAGNDC
jgi:hypothetical protein